MRFVEAGAVFPDRGRRLGPLSGLTAGREQATLVRVVAHGALGLQEALEDGRKIVLGVCPAGHDQNQSGKATGGYV